MAAVEQTGDGFGQPASDWFSITPSDSNELAIRPRALYAGSAGTLVVVSKLGNTMTITVAVGYHPLRPVKVGASTTVSPLYGLY